MGYLPKALGDKFNEERAKFFNAPRPVPAYCVWCSIKGKGQPTLERSDDNLVCPICGDVTPYQPLPEAQK